MKIIKLLFKYIGTQKSIENDKKKFNYKIEIMDEFDLQSLKINENHFHILYTVRFVRTCSNSFAELEQTSNTYTDRR